MMWLQAHLTMILTVWGAVWALATALQSAFPPASWAWKACHAVLAVSPLDFMKAIKTVGTSLVPPAAAILLVLVASTSACGNAAPAKTAAQARAEARAAVVSVESAWMLVAQTCVTVAKSDDDPILAKCAAVLDPVKADLEAADDVVNAWTDATSNAPLACKVSKALSDIESAGAILGVKSTTLTDAETLVGIVAAGACPDGGK